MIVHWVVDGVQVDSYGNYHSSLATNRYRAILPALGLRELGHKADLIQMSDWAPQKYLPQGLPNVVMIGKLLPSSRFDELRDRLLDGIVQARLAGVKVLSDINDDHFDHPLLGSLWQKLVTAVDGVVAGSEAMADVVKLHTDLPVYVVGDPVGSPLGEPDTYRPAEGWTQGLVRLLEVLGHDAPPIRLVWFGAHGNWPSMESWVVCLTQLAARRSWQLTVISRPGEGIEDFVSGFNAALPRRALIEFVPWAENTVWKYVQDAHFVLIPSELSKRGKTVKSANRLVDALHNGRFVIASPVPAYEPFTDFVWLGENPVAGIEWALSHSDETIEKIRLGQQRVAERHSLSSIAAQWAEVLRSSVIVQTNDVLGATVQHTPRLSSQDGGTAPSSHKLSTALTAEQIWDLYTTWFYDTKVWKQMIWHGVRTLKVPADMWNYQEIVFERKIDHIIETGTRHGGSALFFAETLAARGAKGPVISIDIDDISRHIRSYTGIHFLLGSSSTPDMVAKVRSILPADRGPVFLILDSDHRRNHVYSELEVWVPFLEPGDYLVVEDTNVNGHPVRPEHGPGPWEAVKDYILNHPGLLEPDLHRERKFGSTAAPSGYYVRC